MRDAFGDRVELGIVIESRVGAAGTRPLEELLARVRIKGYPSMPRPRFGKERHPAGLDYGACCSYALAVQRAEPLLLVGDDFSKTDVVAA